MAEPLAITVSAEPSAQPAVDDTALVHKPNAAAATDKQPLTPVFVFGVQSSIVNALLPYSHDSVVYCAGHSVVVYNTATGVQHSLHGSEYNTGNGSRYELQCINLSHNQRYLLYSERNKEPAVTIVDMQTLKKKKKLLLNQYSNVLTEQQPAVYTNMKAHGYVNVCFHPHNFKVLLCVTAQPDYTVLHIDWTTNTLLAVYKLNDSIVMNAAAANKSSSSMTVHHASINTYHTDANTVQLCVTGRSIVTVYNAVCDANTLLVRYDTVPLDYSKFDTDTLSTLQNNDYTCHAWADQHTLLVGTASGSVLLYSRHRLEQIVETDASNSIDCITVHTVGAVKHILLGCNHGAVHHYTQQCTDSDAAYCAVEKHGTYNVDETVLPHVSALCVLPATAENTYKLLCVTDHNQLLHSAVELHGTAADAAAEAEPHKFAPLITNFHSGGIVAADVCYSKQILLTASADRTVRVFDYSTYKQLLCSAVTDIDPNNIASDVVDAVALHPSGLYCALLYKNARVQLCYLYIDAVKAYHCIPLKHCSAVQFSNNGALLSVINDTCVHIYSTYTYELVYILRGHTNTITACRWATDDLSLATCGADGSVVQRVLGTNNKLHDYCNKNIEHVQCCLTGDSEYVYCTTTDQQLLEVNDRYMTKSIYCNTVLTHLCTDRRTEAQKQHSAMYAASSTGLLRIFQYPLNGTVYDYQVHSGPVTALLLADHTHKLITCSTDGSIVVYATRPADDAAVPNSSALLCSRADLDELSLQIAKLKSQIAELEQSNQYQLRLYQNNNADTLRAKQAEYAAELAQLQSQLTDTQQQLASTEHSIQSELNEVRSQHIGELHQLDTQQQKLIIQAIQRYNQLQELLVQREKQHHLKLHHATDAAEQDIAQFTAQHQAQLEALHAAAQQTEQSNAQLARVAAVTEAQQQYEADVEVEAVHARYVTLLLAERDATLRLKGENGIMIKKFLAIQKQIDEQIELIKHMHVQQQQLQQRIYALEQQIAGYKHEITVRDASIGEYERTILKLKKGNITLDKYKYVYDHMIHDLNQQIEPRERQIELLAKQVAEKQQQLQQYQADIAQCNERIAELQAQLKHKQGTIMYSRHTLNQLQHLLHQLLQGIELAAADIQDGDKLQAAVQALYDRYVAPNAMLYHSEPEDAAAVAEAQQQCRQLQQQIAAATQQRSHSVAQSKQQRAELLSGNMQLLQQVELVQRTLQQVDGTKYVRKQGAAEAELQKILQLQQLQMQLLESQLPAAAADSALSDSSNQHSKPGSAKQAVASRVEQVKLPPI